MNKKEYINVSTKEVTTSAAIAMAWHRQGSVVDAWKLTDNKVVRVHGKTQKTRTKREEHNAYCDSIIKEMADYSNGHIKRCPDCGAEINRDWNYVGDQFRCPECGSTTSVDEWEWLSLYDYFNGDSIFDIEYRVGSDKKYRGVRVMVACGGPNISINTISGQVELYWWTDRGVGYIPPYLVEEIDDIFEDYYLCS